MSLPIFIPQCLGKAACGSSEKGKTSLLRSTKAPYSVKAHGKFQDIPSYRCDEKGCKLPFTIRTVAYLKAQRLNFANGFKPLTNFPRQRRASVLLNSAHVSGYRKKRLGLSTTAFVPCRRTPRLECWAALLRPMRRSVTIWI
jgi:hypothetical protein